MNLKTALWDNPVLVKHVRSRLRRQNLIPAVIGVIILSLCITWGAVSWHAVEDGAGFFYLLLLQGLLLFVAGTAQVANSVGQAKESGMLDFHRISPQPPLATTIGFVLGGPIREYILFACTLPFTLYFVLQGHPGPVAYASILVGMLAAAVFYHLLGALSGVLAARGAAAGAVVLVMAIQCFSFNHTGLESLSIIPTVIQAMGTPLARFEHVAFFGVAVPALLLALLHQVVLGGFILAALTRKVRRDRAFFYPKIGAVIFHGAISLLVLGDIWPYQDSRDSMGFSYVLGAYAVFLAALLLSAAVTPAAGEIATGVRRAQKQQRERPSPWDDLAPNWGPLLLISMVTFAAVFLGQVSAGTGHNTGLTLFGGAFTAACAVLYFGSARQYLNLKLGKNNGAYFGLLLFLTWVLPLFLAGLAGSSGGHSEFASLIASISPLVGIGVFDNVNNANLNATAVPAMVVPFLLAVGFMVLRIGVEKQAVLDASRQRVGEERKTALR